MPITRRSSGVATMALFQPWPLDDHGLALSKVGADEPAEHVNPAE
jgi:hypothetical protein